MRKGHPLYKTWWHIMQRCYDRECIMYRWYGGRGIDVYEPWHEFREFAEDILEDLGPKPKGCQLDRIDNDMGYWPGNLRWASSRQNSNNRRDNVVLEAFGDSKTVAQWARDPRCQVSEQCLRLRVKRRGWDAEKAILERPKPQNLVVRAFGEERLLKEWAADPRCRVSRNCLYKRVARGWSPEEAMSKESARCH